MVILEDLGLGLLRGFERALVVSWLVNLMSE